ncbi:bifunctional DNA-formamidopyrimidine glycosylase/DNA-(apurinic or apyrimidinic site) lyase [Sedimenticola sp.]|uniref:bifunctional DNA-formamidopyrimidine glycosylase/DNA-(apurinic or apyrimidinic site) lyase n=1 Tax=Sedimenticola sp. TaxID=1940285 RepID=UPI003D12D57D
MPELPEVETTRRGIAPHIEGQRISGVQIRQPQLRWPIAPNLAELVTGRTIRAVERRAKYLLLRLSNGTLILHLGMSGSLRILPRDTAPGKHDHFDLLFKSCCLRLRDPRRFGAVLWTDQPLAEHPLLAHLGPEPLSDKFDGDYLHRQAGTRRVAVKNLIMDGRVVVGVGNIYANEALFRAGILPTRAANRISADRYARLSEEIKAVLAAAIRQGGTTLRDFQQEDGKPGYFAQELLVYGRTGEPCSQCGAPLKQQRIGQRSSFFCGHCQR